MKSTVVGVFLFLALNVVVRGGECPNAVDHGCGGFAALDIVVSGDCRGTAHAGCKVVTTLQTELKRGFAEWWSDAGKCRKARVESVASAIAAAIAKVWAQVVAEVACGSRGFACGWTIVNAKAYSLAFAEAMAHAAGDAVGDDGKQICFADIRSLAEILAETATSVHERTCAFAGDLVSFSSMYLELSKPGITRALHRASAGACDRSRESAISFTSRCHPKFRPRGDKSKAELGDLCGGAAAAAQSRACIGVVRKLCCSGNEEICTCSAAGCVHGPWMQKSQFNAATGEKRSFESRKGELCFCPEQE